MGSEDLFEAKILRGREKYPATIPEEAGNYSQITSRSLGYPRPAHRYRESKLEDIASVDSSYACVLKHRSYSTLMVMQLNLD